MKKDIVFFLPVVFLSALIGGCRMQETKSLQKKALIVMLDGVRADAIEAVQHPLWVRLKNNSWQESYASVWSLHARPIKDAAPNSAPNHVSILTGVNATQHRVFNNGEIINGNYTEYPTFLEILANTGYSGIFCFTWKEDMFAGKAHPLIQKKHGTDKGNIDSLRRLISGEKAPDISVIYLDDTDHAGHTYQFSPFSHIYMESVKKSMQHVQNLLEAISSRPSFKQEDWLIVICSDHGGYGCSHGMPGGHATTVPLLLCSRHIKPMPDCTGVNSSDIAPFVLEHFGIKSKKTVHPRSLSRPYIKHFAPPTQTVPLNKTIISAGNSTVQFSILQEEKGYSLSLQNKQKTLRLFYFPSDKKYDEMIVRIYPEGVVVFSVKINHIESFISDDLGMDVNINGTKLKAQKAGEGK